MDVGKRLNVFSVRKSRTGDSSLWLKAGSAWYNKDGSINVYLDMLPMEGHLQIRPVVEQPARADGTARQQTEAVQ